MAPGGNMILKTHEGIEVKARQRLNSETEFEKFINAFMEKLDSADGSDVVVSDLDLSQNKLSIDQWCQVITALSAANARVLRFRLFGSASLSDDILIQIADYFAGLTAKQAPQEIHLSDCAITTSGFSYFVEKIESVDYYPLKSGAGRATPLYVRLENNYIEEQAIKEKVDSGVIKPFTKREGRSGGEKGAKINLLVQAHGKFQQKTGTPPAPEDAPPPKQISDHNSRTSWNGAQAKGYANQSWRPESQQWPATRGGTATRWSTGAAIQASRPGITPINKYAGKTITPASTRTMSNYGGNYATHGSVDRSRTPMGRGGNGLNTRGPAGKGFAKGAGKGKSQKLPHPWEEHWSEDYNIPYFWNTETGSSVWERPVA